MGQCEPLSFPSATRDRCVAFEWLIDLETRSNNGPSSYIQLGGRLPIELQPLLPLQTDGAYDRQQSTPLQRRNYQRFNRRVSCARARP